MKPLLFAIAFAIEATSLPGPTSIELIDTWVAPDRPIVGANPMRVGAGIAVRWKHPCTECDFILRLDDTKVTTVQGAGFTTYTHDLGAIPVGVHTIEIEATNGSPCPPPTVQPTGCSRYLTFTVSRDGRVVPQTTANQRPVQEKVGISPSTEP